MLFIYRLKDGGTGSTDSIARLQHNIKKLIVRRYNGDDINIPYVDELILDCNRDDIHGILFKCDNLSIYKPNINWFHINNDWFSNDVELHSTFNTLNRLKLEHVRDTSGMLINTLCSNITTVLDFSSIKISRIAHNISFVPMFHNTQLTSIPKMINPPELSYMAMFHGKHIPESKLKAADVLVAISKKGEIS